MSHGRWRCSARTSIQLRRTSRSCSTPPRPALARVRQVERGTARGRVADEGRVDDRDGPLHVEHGAAEARASPTRAMGPGWPSRRRSRVLRRFPSRPRWRRHHRIRHPRRSRAPSRRLHRSRRHHRNPGIPSRPPPPAPPPPPPLRPLPPSLNRPPLEPLPVTPPVPPPPLPSPLIPPVIPPPSPPVPLRSPPPSPGSEAVPAVPGCPSRSPAPPPPPASHPLHRWSRRTPSQARPFPRLAGVRAIAMPPPPLPADVAGRPAHGGILDEGAALDHQGSLVEDRPSHS